MNGLLLWLRIHVRGGLLVLLVLAVVAELTVGRFAVQIAWAPLQTVHVGLFLPVLTCGIAVLFLHSGFSDFESTYRHAWWRMRSAWAGVVFAVAALPGFWAVDALPTETSIRNRLICLTIATAGSLVIVPAIAAMLPFVGIALSMLAAGAEEVRLWNLLDPSTSWLQWTLTVVFAACGILVYGFAYPKLKLRR